MSHFNGKSILITGGTGSLGNEIVRQLLAFEDVHRIVILSRDELKQQLMRDRFRNDPRLRWFLGDIRDEERLRRAFHGVDYVVHAAALKQVDTGEYNPMEFIKTNVMGSQNVIEAAIDSGVTKVVALSTDKASSPINLYGATKLTADKLFIAANNYSQGYGTSFSVVRYGNVMGSRGSVIPNFLELSRSGLPIPITDARMTRFWISIEAAARFVLDSFPIMTGGELYVPKIPSMRIVDLAKAIAPNSDVIEIGIRPGEKLHEEMISKEDSRRTKSIDHSRMVMLPVVSEWNYLEPEGNFLNSYEAYSSDTNENWVSIDEMRKFIAEKFPE